MARMYIDFETNLKDTINELENARVDYVTFRNKEKDVLVTVEGEECDWSIENGHYSSRLKGLKFRVEPTLGDGEKEFLRDFDKDVTPEDFELLKNAEVWGMRVYFPTAESVIPEPAKVENLTITVSYLDKDNKETEIKYSKDAFIAWEDFSEEAYEAVEEIEKENNLD